MYQIRARNSFIISLFLCDLTVLNESYLGRLDKKD